VTPNLINLEKQEQHWPVRTKAQARTTRLQRLRNIIDWKDVSQIHVSRTNVPELVNQNKRFIERESQ